MTTYICINVVFINESFIYTKKFLFDLQIAVIDLNTQFEGLQHVNFYLKMCTS